VVVGGADDDARLAVDDGRLGDELEVGPLAHEREQHLPDLLAAGGVLLLPGSVYDEPEHVRFGYGRANLPEAVAQLEELLG
jgi:hypothetical protein